MASVTTELKHVTFSPLPLSLSDSPLQQVCLPYEKEGWRLVRVVPHHMYESVAVFQRRIEQSDKEES